MNRILIVDDCRSVRTLLGEFLESQGFECTLAMDVAHARMFLNRIRFDLVVSDLHMPSESGLALLRHIVCKYSCTAFILITASLDARVEKLALKMGADSCIAKPFNLTDLMVKVTNALQERIPPCRLETVFHSSDTLSRSLAQPLA